MIVVKFGGTSVGSAAAIRALPAPSATSMARCWQTADMARISPARLRTTMIGSPIILVVK